MSAPSVPPVPPWRTPKASGHILVDSDDSDHGEVKHGKAFSSDDCGDGPSRDSQVINANVAQQSTSKIPPYWSPELEKQGSPFRVYTKDARLWCAGTELTPDKQGPAIIQRLGGTSRELLREAPIELIQYGRYDAAGNQLAVGVDVVLNGLNQRFGQLDVESSISNILSSSRSKGTTGNRSTKR